MTAPKTEKKAKEPWPPPGAETLLVRAITLLTRPIGFPPRGDEDLYEIHENVLVSFDAAFARILSPSGLLIVPTTRIWSVEFAKESMGYELNMALAYNSREEAAGMMQPPDAAEDPNTR